MKRGLLWIAAFLAATTIVSLLVVVLGIVPIKASSGHWAITTWLLDFAKRRSVSTHSLRIDVPPLGDPHLLAKGAGHYEIGCAQCHGSPALLRPRLAREMTPPPPYLSPRIARWDSAELFYIVKHGIKLTAMPAWPAQGRDDEVWAVVAFLQRMPELDAAEYRLLAHGESASADAAASLQVPKAVTETCASCHGHAGRGRAGGAFPRLAGQTPQYLEAALDAYATGRRHSGIMEVAVTELTAAERRELAQYYAGLPPAVFDSEPQSPIRERPPDSTTVETSAARERGEAIAFHGIPEQGVPSCSDCHGPIEHERTPTYPRLFGQHGNYLVLQLELFRERKRGGSPSAHLMWPVASRLTPDQIHDVALYYASAGGAD